MDQLAENVTQGQRSEIEKQEPQELAEDIGESVSSNVIRIQEPVCSNLSGDPWKGPQCSESDAPGDGANDHNCEAPFPCKIRKSSASDEADAKRRRQNAEDDRVQPLCPQLPPVGGTQAQDDCATELPPSRVRKLNQHDLSVGDKRRRRGNKRKLDLQHDVGQKRICFRKPNSVQRIDAPGPSSEVLEAAVLPSTVPVMEGQQQDSVQLARAARAVPLRGAPGPAV